MADKKLDFNFELPPHVEGLSYVDPDIMESVEDLPDGLISNDDPSDEGESNDGNGGDEGEDPLPSPPDNMTVVSQTAKTLKGGGQVVDVVIELPDLPAGEKYDIRLTKV